MTKRRLNLIQGICDRVSVLIQLHKHAPRCLIDHECTADCRHWKVQNWYYCPWSGSLHECGDEDTCNHKAVDSEGTFCLVTGIQLGSGESAVADAGLFVGGEVPEVRMKDHTSKKRERGFASTVAACVMSATDGDEEAAEAAAQTIRDEEAAKDAEEAAPKKRKKRIRKISKAELRQLPHGQRLKSGRVPTAYNLAVGLEQSRYALDAQTMFNRCVVVHEPTKEEEDKKWHRTEEELEKKKMETMTTRQKEEYQRRERTEREKEDAEQRRQKLRADDARKREEDRRDLKPLASRFGSLCERFWVLITRTPSYINSPCSFKLDETFIAILSMCLSGFKQPPFMCLQAHPLLSAHFIGVRDLPKLLNNGKHKMITAASNSLGVCVRELAEMYKKEVEELEKQNPDATDDVVYNKMCCHWPMEDYEARNVLEQMDEEVDADEGMRRLQNELARKMNR